MCVARYERDILRIYYKKNPEFYKISLDIPDGGGRIILAWRSSGKVSFSEVVFVLWPAMRKSSEEGREMECKGGERFEACVRMSWFSSGFPLF